MHARSCMPNFWLVSAHPLMDWSRTVELVALRHMLESPRLHHPVGGGASEDDLSYRAASYSYRAIPHL